MKESWGVEPNGVGVYNPGRQHAPFGPDFRLNGSPVASHCGEMDMRNCTDELGALRWRDVGGSSGRMGSGHADGARVFGAPGDRGIAVNSRASAAPDVALGTQPTASIPTA